MYRIEAMAKFKYMSSTLTKISSIVLALKIQVHWSARKIERAIGFCLIGRASVALGSVHILLGQVLKSAPALAILDVIEFLSNFFFGVPAGLDDFPEVDPFVETDRTVVVDVNCIKELFSADLGEGPIPVV